MQTNSLNTTRYSWEYGPQKTSPPFFLGPLGRCDLKVTSHKHELKNTERPNCKPLELEVCDGSTCCRNTNENQNERLVPEDIFILKGWGEIKEEKDRDLQKKSESGGRGEEKMTIHRKRGPRQILASGMAYW